MRIDQKVLAPDFEALDLDGCIRSLRQYRGRYLLLQFYRYASCPMCDLRLHDFAREYPRLKEKGLEVIAFFHSSPEKIRGHFKRHPRSFPIVADPSRHLYRRYGVETSWPAFLLSILKPRFYWDWLRSMRHGFLGGVGWPLASMPADFLIGPDGTMLRVHYGRDIGDHMSVHELERALAGAAEDTEVMDRGGATSSSNPNPNESMTSFSALVAFTVLWALALIASSYFLQGLVLGEWVDAMLYLGAGLWLGACTFRMPSSRCA